MTTQYNTGFSDAQAVNDSERSNFIYKDLNLFFTPNPVTKDISKVTDIQAIKRSVRNLVLLNPGENPFHPEIGTGIRDALFENFTPPVREALRSKIENIIKLYEPRVTVISVSFNDISNARLDNNRLDCTIQFIINNVPQNVEEVEVMLQRIR